MYNCSKTESRFASGLLLQALLIHRPDTNHSTVVFKTRAYGKSSLILGSVPGFLSYLHVNSPLGWILRFPKRHRADESTLSQKRELSSSDILLTSYFNIVHLRFHTSMIAAAVAQRICRNVRSYGRFILSFARRALTRKQKKFGNS